MPSVQKSVRPPEDVVEMNRAWPRQRGREFPEVLRKLLEISIRIVKGRSMGFAGIWRG